MSEYTTSYYRLKDKKIMIYELVDVSEPGEMPTTEYRPLLAAGHWAYFRQLSSEELYINNATNTQEEVIFYVNWRNDLKAGQIIQFQDDFYQVTRIDAFEGYKDDLKLYAKKSDITSDEISNQ